MEPNEKVDEPRESKPSKAEKALALALDIRKFEINLYWKRATYFWAFLAVALAGYFGIFSAKDLQDHPNERAEALFIVSCLGFVFSVAWYFVNRGSKFWQENWEKHVDLLEDPVNGPLYKIVLSDAETHFLKFWGPYPFSVTRLNQLLSLFVAVLFLLLATATLWRYYSFGWPPDGLVTSMLFVTVGAVVALFFLGRSGPRKAFLSSRSYRMAFDLPELQSPIDENEIEGVTRARAERRVTEIV